MLAAPLPRAPFVGHQAGRLPDGAAALRAEATAAQLVEQVERDGCFVLRDFLDAQSVLATRAELAALLDDDLARRQAPHSAPGGPVAPGFLNAHQHALLFPSVHSPGLACLMEQIVADPLIVSVMERVLGRHYRLRLDLVRRLTGVNDYIDAWQLPHEWHRDSPGEFTFGIFFDDVTPVASGGTIALRGSHWWPYLPPPLGWRVHLGDDPARPRVGPRLMCCAVLTRVLGRRLPSRVRELRGKPGDIFFFLNDLWHGRAPNVHGARNVVVRFGGFPTDFAFKHDVALPPEVATLPPGLAARYAREQRVNTDPTTLVRRLAARRPRRPDLFYAACLERKLLAKSAQMLARAKVPW